jgi:subtilase family serine protease
VVGLPTTSGGPRYLPDVSLFAANGTWGHFLVFCMTDQNEGGAPACTYTNTTDVLDLAAGGTSFSSPSLAGIQALVNQKLGAKQGNPNAVYYKLAATEFGATGSTVCNSSGGTTTKPVLPASTCIFNDVTLGDMDVNCTGTIDCFGSSNARRPLEGALSTSSTTFTAAFAAGTGWDFATGLGTINATNLVNNF